MSVLLVAVPVAVLLAIAGVVAFLWAARGGQFDDLETPPLRMLLEDESARPACDRRSAKSAAVELSAGRE
jgi:cbb3-type cytochrome oxidase maturation protein